MTDTEKKSSDSKKKKFDGTLSDLADRLVKSMSIICIMLLG